MSGFFSRLKKKFYFRVAGYFGFFAARVLKKWQPQIIVVTGSSGKTTTLNMLEAQLGDKAIFSHHANSAVGVPFHILGMDGIQDSRWEWIGKFLKAPLQASRVKHKANIYVVEADADRPGEGEFLAKLLKPMVTVWVSSSRTHSMNFEALVKSGKFNTLEEAIAHEYSHFADYTSRLVITDGDNPDIKAALQDKQITVKYVYHKEAIEDYRISEGESMVTIAGKHTYIFRQPQPPVISYQVAFVDEVLKLLEVTPDYSFERLDFPPGRSRVFKSALEFTIIDSTYNSNLDSMRAMLQMFERYPGDNKLLVLGDMLEQGGNEEAEHKKLAELVLELDFKPKQVILLGPRVKRYTFAILRDEMPTVPVSIFVNPHDVLDYLRAEIKGGEVVLFKGARFLEGVIENLLADPQDAKFLARRGNIWRKRRAEWGL
ncbi:MAG: hypothetical protein GY745_21295 [Actinomycetia bacterium]|nr:hypothetical protein [Actinomycetes bacterium]